MSVSPFLRQLIDVGYVDPAATLTGIELVDHEIEQVIDAVGRELREFRPADFERGAEIVPASFGGADRAGDLGSHHSRAHAVMFQTLTGLETDLDQFALACKQAREILTDTDQDAADALTRNLRLLDVLDQGTQGDNAASAYDDARNDPANQGEDV